MALFPYITLHGKQAHERYLLNGFPEGAPSDYFDEDIAKGAIDAAKALVQWSRSIVAG